jgi:hypothetical protein
MALTRPRAYQIYDIDYKQAVRVVAITNVTLSGGAPNSVDGVSLSLNDRVLVTGQSSAVQNGIYYVTTVGSGANGTWARSTDTNTTGELLSGTIVMVTEGSTYADTQWKLTTNDPITIGSTALTFVQNYLANSISFGQTSFAIGSSNANATVSVAGVSNVAVFTTQGANITGNVISSGNISGTYLLGNVYYATGFSASKIYNGTSEINIGTSGGAANISIGGTSNVAVFSSTGVAITGDLSVSGNATLSGNILGDRLQNGTTSIDIQTASGNANISVAGTSNVVVFSSSGQNVTGYLTASGNVTSSGNVVGTYLLGNVYYATGFSASKIYNGTSEVNIGTSGGAANISIGGTSNVVVVSSTGANITGTLGVSGNTTVGNITATIGTFTTFTSAQGGNVTGTLIATSANAQFINQTNPAGYLTAAGYATVTGNITGGNLLTAGLISATGNITSSANVAGVNILGNGRNLTGINTFSSLAVTGSDTITANSIATGLTFTGDTSIVVTANAATNTVSFAFGGAGDSIFSTGGTMGLVDEAPLTEEDLGLVTDAVTEEYDLGGFFLDGLVGNDNFLVNSINGNILAANAVITTTGNITAGNLIATANLVSVGAVVSGNVTSGNLLTSGQVVSTGAVYSNFNTNTANTASFNATGGNTKGGTGYLDFLVAQNTSGGATNPFKWFRTNITGGLEIINSAYNNLLLSLTDAGALSVAGSISVAGKKAVNGPAFRASIAVGQTITSGTQQKVTFGTETFDTDGNFASSRFTPTTEGYYQLNSTVRIAGGSSTGEYMLVIWKNGSEYSRGSNGSGTEIGASFYSLQVSDIAYANGTTDYFEIYIQQTSGASKDTTAGPQISYFSGVMVRGA